MSDKFRETIGKTDKESIMMFLEKKFKVPNVSEMMFNKDEFKLIRELARDRRNHLKMVTPRSLFYKSEVLLTREK